MGKSWGARYWIMLACFGGGAFIASVVWIFLWLVPSSDEIVKVAGWRLLHAGNFRVATDLQYQGGTGEKAANMRWESEGDVENRADGLRTTQDFSVQLGGQQEMTMTGRLAHQAKTNFVTFKDVPERFGSLNMQIFRDKTLRLDPESVLASLPSVPVVGGLRLNDADRRQLGQVAASIPFLQVEGRLKDEALRNVTAHHYKVRLEMIYVRDFLKLVEAKRLGRDLTIKEQNAFDTSFADFVSDDGELWVSANGYYPLRLRLRLYDKADARGGYWTVALNFSRYGEIKSVPDVDLTGAEDATPYLNSLLAAYASHLPMAKEGSGQRTRTVAGGLPVEKIATADVDSDKDGLSLLLERFYGSDPLNPDSDGDGMDDGAEVVEARSPMGPWNLFDFTQGQFR
jgi:hypothetical protein